jgi:hypothetical protein
MKMHLHQFLIASLVIMLYSCNQHSPTAQVNRNDTVSAFDTFMTQFPVRELPIVIRPCPGSKPFSDNSELKSIDSASGAPFKISGGYLAFGKIKTNGDYKALVTLGAADCLGVVLCTFDKSGKPIDNKYIGIGQCGSGPGFSCTEVVKLGADYTIYSADSITEQETDSIYWPIAGGKIFTYVVYKKGKLCMDGHIELSPEKRDTLKIERDTSSIWVKP